MDDSNDLKTMIFRTTYEMIYSTWNDALEDLNLDDCLKFKNIYDEFKQKYNELNFRAKTELADLREAMMWLNRDVDEQLLSCGNGSTSKQQNSSSDSGDDECIHWESKRSPSE